MYYLIRIEDDLREFVEAINDDPNLMYDSRVIKARNLVLEDLHRWLNGELPQYYIKPVTMNYGGEDV